MKELIDWTKPLITGGGAKARFMGKVLSNGVERFLIAYFVDEKDSEYVMRVDEYGRTYDESIYIENVRQVDTLSIFRTKQGHIVTVANQDNPNLLNDDMILLETRTYERP